MTATIILDGVNIKGSNPFNAQSAKDIALILVGDNTITSTGGGPAVSCPVGADTNLTIREGDDQVGSLQASVLGADNLRFPGIGFNGDAKGSIIIESGTIEVKGGAYSAGIGHKISGKGGSIIIRGGIINATAGGSSSGIGGAYQGGNVNIQIDGGIVKAKGSANGAAIGTGFRPVQKSVIRINGGIITAEGGSYAPGIGGGNREAHQNPALAGEDVIITGGIITAMSSTPNYGIGNKSTMKATNSSFSTGETGKAIIFASGISDQSGKESSSWSGMIFEGTEGLIYGDSYQLTQDMTIPADKKLTIEQNKTLTINDGITLTNNGIIRNGGSITRSGILITHQSQIIGSGVIQLPFTDEMLTLSNQSFKYDGKEKTFSSVTVKKGNVTYSHEGETPDYTIAYANNINAATTESENPPTITITPTDNGLLFGDPVSRTFSIAKESSSPEMFTFTTHENMTYDGNQREVTIYCGEQTGFEAVYFDNAGNPLTEAPTQAGDYTFKIDLEGNPNFEPVTGLIEKPGVWKFTIAKADPTFAAWQVNGKPFDALAMSGITAPTLNGIEQDGPIDTEGLLSYTYYYLQEDKEPAVTTPENAGATEEGAAPAWVGDYKVVATFAGNTNYKTKETDATFSITKVYPSFTAIEVSRTSVYDGTAKVASAKVKGVAAETDLYEATIRYEQQQGDTYVAMECEPINAGDYRAIASFTHRNYTDITTDMPMTITPKPLSATTATLSEVTFTYNGTDQQPTVTEVKEGETTLVAGTDYTVTGPEASVVARSYEMTITGKGNYQGTCTKAYTIEKATPTYTVPTGLTAIFGETLADVTLPSADDGAWSWQAEETTLVGSVGPQTFKATRWSKMWR